ncbi:MAG: outer membrane beta-barrel protein [Chryseotalea sp.]|jgi:hypothetical protein
MTVEERVAAYKLLCLTKIYLEEPEEADVYMLKILQTNHEFEIKESVDPAEFVALYKTFRTDPIYRLGGRLGGVLTNPNVESSDIVNDGASSYQTRLGFSIHLTAEIPLNRKLSKFTINPELVLQGKSFAHTNALSDFESEGIERQRWLSLPVVLQYKVFENKNGPKKGTFKIYGGLGASLDYLLSSEITVNKIRGESASALPEKSIDVKDQRESLSYSLVAVTGFKKKLGKGWLIGEVRYQYGLKAITKKENTFANPTLTFDYGLVDSIFRQNTLTVSAGYVINIYKPKKLNK